MLLSAAAAAHAAAGTSVRTTGEATVRAQPDTARFQLSVMTFGDDAEQAAAENAQRTDAVLAQLKSKLKKGAEIRTEGYSIEPSRKRPRNEGPGEITGYTVRNNISVETKELERMGEILDLATRAGADQVNWVRFELSDPGESHAEALRRAVAQARRSADAIAGALGTKVARVVSVNEDGAAPPRPMMMARAQMESMAATPIEVGEVDVQARVTLEVELE